MTSSTSNESAGPKKDQPGAARHPAFGLAEKAFDYIERYQTPPDPCTYAVWYTYAEQSNPDLTASLEQALAKGGTLGPYELGELCRTHLHEGTLDVEQTGLRQKFEKELASVIALIQQSIDNTTAFSSTLEAVEDDLPKAASPESLKRIVAHLIAENRRMAQQTKDLNRGLRESQRQVAELNRELDEVQNQSLRDPLTAIANRRAFDLRIETEVQRARESGASLCLVMADIDHFKRVNDTHGHLVGDAVLKIFASLIAKNIKGQDMVARYGGEEFAILLPQTDIISAYNLMVKIKQRFEKTELLIRESRQKIGTVTASFGISVLKPGMTVRELMERADEKLYAAKHAGRNCVKADGLSF